MSNQSSDSIVCACGRAKCGGNPQPLNFAHYVGGEPCRRTETIVQQEFSVE